MSRRLLEIVLLCSAALPLVVVKGAANPFLTPREAVFRVMIALALPLFVFIVPWTRPRLRVFGWSVVGLLAATLAATVMSVDRTNSFWGNSERLTGFVDLALAAVYGLMLFQAFRSRTFRNRFLAAWTVVWGIIAAWALLEKIIPGFWAQFNGDGARSVATIGNAIFLAHGLILALPPVFLYVWTRFPGTKGRWAAAGATALITAAVFATGTRGAFLGLLAGASVAAFLYALWSTRRAVRAAGFAAPAVALLLVVGLFVFRDASWLAQLPFLSRAVAVFKLDPSHVQRLQLWNVALSAIRARPAFGWGPENFDMALDLFYDPGLTRFAVAQSFSDRAHNGFLDVAAASGLVGLLAYLTFLAAAAGRAVAARKAGALGNVPVAIMIGGLAAYAVAIATAFDSQITYLCLAVFGALLASLDAPASEPQRSPPTIRAAAALAAAGLGVWFLIAATVPLVRGAELAHVALTAPPDADLSSPARQIVTFANPYRAGQEQRIANEMFKRIGNAPAWLPAFGGQLALAEGLMRDAVALRPGNFGTRFTLANVLLLEAMHGLQPYDGALRTIEEARLLAPRRQMVDYQLGNLYLTRKDGASAVAAFERALALDPSVAESHWHLGRGLAATGDAARAAAEFRIAWQSGFRDPRPREEDAVAVKALTESGDLATVRDIYAYRAEVAATDPDLYAALAAVHAALGERDAAIAALQTAVRLDPTLRDEAAAFLRTNGYPDSALPPL